MTIYDLLMAWIGKIQLVFLLCFISLIGFGQVDINGLSGCLTIGFDVNETTFPSHWHNSKINAQAQSLSKSETNNVIITLKKTLSKYPEKVLCAYLKQIFVFKSMRFYGVPFGGTSSKQTVYITNDEDNFTCSYNLLENYFHHEFSSILLHKNPCKFQKRKWKRINPEDFRYGKGGLQAIVTGTAEMNFDYELNERGFLTRYSEASVEEDFNVYCQNIFNGGEAFWKLVDKFQKIKAKTELVLQFYHRIDPNFNLQYFNSLTQ